MKLTKFEWTIILPTLLCMVVAFVFSCNREIKDIPDAMLSDKEAIELQMKDSLLVNRFAENQSARGKTVNFYHVGATYHRDRFGDNEVYYGMAFETVVTKFRLGGDKIKSNWIDFYYEATNPDGTISRDWVQWGYMVHKDWGLSAGFFVYTFSNNSGGQKPVEIRYHDNPKPLKYGELTRFEIKNIPGTTWWAFSRNGSPVFDANLLATEAKGSFGCMTESWGGDNFSPQIKINYVDLLKNDGTWIHVPHAEIQQPRVWECKGQLQDNSLGTSAMLMGGRPDESISYHQLW